MTLIIGVKYDSHVFLFGDTAVYDQNTKELTSNEALKVGRLTENIGIGLACDNLEGALSFIKHLREGLLKEKNTTDENHRLIKLCRDHKETSNGQDTGFELLLTVNRSGCPELLHYNSIYGLQEVNENIIAIGSGSKPFINEYKRDICPTVAERNKENLNHYILKFMTLLNIYGVGAKEPEAKKSYFGGLFTYIKHGLREIQTQPPTITNLCMPIKGILQVYPYHSFWFEGAFFIYVPQKVPPQIIITSPLDLDCPAMPDGIDNDELIHEFQEKIKDELWKKKETILDTIEFRMIINQTTFGIEPIVYTGTWHEKGKGLKYSTKGSLIPEDARNALREIMKQTETNEVIIDIVNF